MGIERNPDVIGAPAPVDVVARQSKDVLAAVPPGPRVGIDAAEDLKPISPMTWKDFSPGGVIGFSSLSPRWARYAQRGPRTEGSELIKWRGWLAKGTSLDTAFDFLREAREEMRRRQRRDMDRPGLWETEIEVISKSVIEDGYSLGWQLPKDGAVRDDRSEPLPSIPVVCAWALAQTLSDPYPKEADFSVPVGSQNGSPTDGAGIESVLAHDALGDFMRTRKMDGSVSSAREALEPVWEASYIMASMSIIGLRVISRTGPVAKWLPWWTPLLNASSEAFQWVPRRRMVLLMVMWFSQMFREPAVREKKMFQSRIHWKLTTDEVIMKSITDMINISIAYWATQGVTVRREDYIPYEGDLSGFDTTVRYADQVAIAEGLHTPVAQAPDARRPVESATEWYLWAQKMPLLLSRLEGSRLALMERVGGTPSGIVTTTNDGIVIGSAIANEICSVLLGKSPAGTWRLLIEYHAIVFLNWGDDILLFVPSFLVDDGTADKIKAHLAQWGYKLTFARGAFFLFRYRDHLRYETFASAGRVLQRYFFKENPPANWEVEAVGDFERMKLLIGHPMYPWIDERIWRYKPGYRRFGVKSLSDLHRLVSSPAVQLAIQKLAARRDPSMVNLIAGITRGSSDPLVIRSLNLPWLSRGSLAAIAKWETLPKTRADAPTWAATKSVLNRAADAFNVDDKIRVEAAAADAEAASTAVRLAPDVSKDYPWGAYWAQLNLKPPREDT